MCLIKYSVFFLSCSFTFLGIRELNAKFPRQIICDSESNPYLEVKDKMLKEVALAWDCPQTCVVTESCPKQDPRNRVLEKLRSIYIESVNFNDSPLNAVVSMLSDLSVRYDTSSGQDRGVNFVLIDPARINPSLSLSLRNLSLEQILELIVRSVDFHYEIENGVVVLNAGRPNHKNLQTDFFPITRGTLVRLIGARQSGMGQNGSGEYFSEQMYEEMELKNFFQRAGIPFDFDHQGPEGADFAFDGTQLIVTQTPRNLEKIRNVLERYKEVYQVEIESKFMEVQQGVLEELGFRWNVTNTDKGKESFFQTNNGYDTNLRGLSDNFSSRRRASSDGKIITKINNKPEVVNIVNKAPIFPNTINLGLNSVPVGGVFSIVDNWRVKLIIDALEQHTGTDLMSAPKVTVLSGKTAKITVAQILRYPEAFGDIQSAVGMVGDAKNSSAGVTITAGTPQQFVEKNVGVEMQVTPIVEQDGNYISLKLEPRVTEFEGFVEYGGRSVAISGDTTVDVPSGFFQPIFSTREIQTEVTIANGATVIMGGLTREEVKQVDDRVPILGSIPLIGRLFRSKGETNQKRNLLIFVTANLIGLGGAPLAGSSVCNVAPEPLQKHGIL
ncbi:MAG: hypothetical protein C5B43_04940 [Verrucomicrobia bacterium]|nr:MAG: hypothetical protein C5B43_04940 [Verrucomicrobiota bacterium]